MYKLAQDLVFSFIQSTTVNVKFFYFQILKITFEENFDTDC